jgi:hypothetical protein
MWCAQVAESRCEELGPAMDDVNVKLSLWRGQPEFKELTVAWGNTHFESLEVPAMEEAINKFHKMVFRMEKSLPPNPLVPKFRATIDEYRNLIPCVQALRNKYAGSSRPMPWHHYLRNQVQVLCPVKAPNLFSVLLSSVAHFCTHVDYNAAGADPCALDLQQQHQDKCARAEPGCCWCCTQGSEGAALAEGVRSHRRGAASGRVLHPGGRLRLLSVLGPITRVTRSDAQKPWGITWARLSL